MKKLVLIAIMLLVPFTAFALESMDDAALDEMTAQEGVTITFEGVTITQGTTDTAWGDTDGIGSGTTGGWIYMDQTSGGSEISLDGTSLTIDVATASADIVVGSGGETETIASGTTFVKIGLPSVTIGNNATTTVLSLRETLDDATPGVLGSLYQNTDGQTEVVGDIYIYAH